MSTFKCNVEKDVFLVNKEGSNIKANVNVTIAGAFVVRGLKVMDGANGLFVSMPSYKKNDGEFVETAFPITKDARDELVAEVLRAYDEKVSAS